MRSVSRVLGARVDENAEAKQASADFMLLTYARAAVNASLRLSPTGRREP